MTGRIVICPTPIGNLGDMTARALEALQDADVICAEDTRVTGKLLAALGVEGKSLERLDENVIAERADQVVQRALAGETIVFCSDAGMPGVSDPGMALVRAARAAAVPVEVLPGPSAAATAYVASGTEATTFYFGGFFPRKDNARRRSLADLSSLDAALIFYESPNRLAESLQVIADIFPFRDVTVCRELTKMHEEVVRGLAPVVAEEFANRASIKGEVVIVIDAPSAAEREGERVDAHVAARIRAQELAEVGERAKAIAGILTEELGIPRNDAYDLALEASKAARGQG